MVKIHLANTTAAPVSIHLPTADARWKLVTLPANDQMSIHDGDEAMGDMVIARLTKMSIGHADNAERPFVGQCYAFEPMDLAALKADPSEADDKSPEPKGKKSGK